jgi:hypothetical protein
MDPAASNLVRVGREPGCGGAAPRARVAVGFGSPAGDSGVTRLDLNDILVPQPQATFLMRARALQRMGLPAAALRRAFEATEFGKVWGLGRRMSARLNEGRIRSVQDLPRSTAWRRS